MNKAFTLVEMLIVVALLGILAAAVLPTFSGHVQAAKESAAKDNLRILRNAIELYAAQHTAIPPGYMNGNTHGQPDGLWAAFQLTQATNTVGRFARPGTTGYDYGPYLQEMPANSFNGDARIYAVGNDEDFPAPPQGDFGWLYKAATKKVKLNSAGTDSKGISYAEY